MTELSEFEVTIFDALADAFENMAFMEVNRTKDTLTNKQLKSYLCSSLSFKGTFDGIFYLYINKDLLEQIAEDLYNLEPENIDEHIERDIIGEINNTFVGEFLTKTVPEDKMFSMGLPETKDNIGDNEDHSLVVHYLVEEWSIRIELVETS